jgi:hypothetical protein
MTRPDDRAICRDIETKVLERFGAAGVEDHPFRLIVINLKPMFLKL